jgi:hypothetical protein
MPGHRAGAGRLHGRRHAARPALAAAAAPVTITNDSVAGRWLWSWLYAFLAAQHTPWLRIDDRAST